MKPNVPDMKLNPRPNPRAAELHYLRAKLRAGSICIWTLGWALSMAASRADQTEPEAVFELTDGSTRAESVAFSPDLKYIAAKASPGSVQIWDVGHGRRLAGWRLENIASNGAAASSFPSQGGQIAFLAGSNRALVVSGSNLAVHDLFTGAVWRSLDPLPPGLGEISEIVLSANGTRAAGRPMANQGQDGLTVPSFVFWRLNDGHQLLNLPTTMVPSPWDSMMASTWTTSC